MWGQPRVCYYNYDKETIILSKSGTPPWLSAGLLNAARDTWRFNPRGHPWAGPQTAYSVRGGGPGLKVP